MNQAKPNILPLQKTCLDVKIMCSISTSWCAISCELLLVYFSHWVDLQLD